jgi:hypothetical protein
MLHAIKQRIRLERVLEAALLHCQRAAFAVHAGAAYGTW